jgi:hypothetical protein
MPPRSSHQPVAAVHLTGYRRLWWATWLTVGVPTAAVGALESPIPAVVLAVIVLGTRLGCALVDAEHVWRTGAAALTGTLLLVAGGPVLGSATVPLAALACATSAPVVGILLRAVGADRAYPELSPGEWPADPDSCLGEMSGEELCRLWSRSFTVVRTATDPRRRAAAAALRARILDELERRDGDALAGWLAGHPSPAAEPRWFGDDVT